MSTPALHRHFQWREFASGSAGVPTVAHQGVYKLVETLLVPLRWQFGPCRITSGYRTLEHNKRVGGAMDSRHLYANHPWEPAVDVRFEKGTPAMWAAAAEQLLRDAGGIGTYRGHVHLDRRRGRARWAG